MNNAAAFKRCLPALHQLARFPLAERAYCCRKRGLDLNDVDATQRAILLELGRTIWNEDALQDAAALFDVTLPELTYAKPLPLAMPEPVTRQINRAMHAHKLPMEIQMDTPPAKTAQAKRSWGSRSGDYLKVCQLLLADPFLAENKACAQVGLKSSWAYFKKKHFGTGRIDVEALRKEIARMSGVPLSEVVVPPAVLEEAVTESVPMSEISVLRPSSGTKSEARPPATQEDAFSTNYRRGIYDGERRRLVFMLAAGILARQGELTPLDETVELAFSLYDDLLERAIERSRKESTT